MTPVLVFDSTCLNHFARAGRLATLMTLSDSYRCVTTVEVRAEIAVGAREIPALEDLLAAEWLNTVELTEPSELAAFARFKTQLGGGPVENVGEAAVLAWTSYHGGTAIIDERAGTRIAQQEGIAVHGSLWLIVGGARSGEIRRAEAEGLVDELRATGMRLPIDGAGLFGGPTIKACFRDSLLASCPSHPTGSVRMCLISPPLGLRSCWLGCSFVADQFDNRPEMSWTRLPGRG